MALLNEGAWLHRDRKSYWAYVQMGIITFFVIYYTFAW